MFVVIFLLLMSFFISSELCSTPKLSKYVTLLLFAGKAIQEVSIDFYLSGFIMYVSSFATGADLATIFGKTFLE